MGRLPNASFRAPGIVRRKRLLAAARVLLTRRDLDQISLADVARAARIPKGSAYHYYGDILDLYVALIGVLGEEMLEDVRRPLRGPARTSWHDIVAALVRRGARYFNDHRAARQLLISPKTPPELKLRDRQSDKRIARLFEEQIERRFVLPRWPGRTETFFRAVEIADLMFSLSMLEHGCITAQMTEEAIRGVTGYLRSHLATRLPRRAATALARRTHV
ncbi:MAG TPA: helix-turn-helix domain-containing protein [Steroidobacteraceae bacterium]|nr:helix-turn-helix domain-containing protein [Steroidobacteraceae bacterium]